MVAAASGSEHSARALLARGATADARDAAGRTALCTQQVRAGPARVGA